jgi:hypothetical protein
MSALPGTIGGDTNGHSRGRKFEHVIEIPRYVSTMWQAVHVSMNLYQMEIVKLLYCFDQVVSVTSDD